MSSRTNVFVSFAWCFQLTRYVFIFKLVHTDGVATAASVASAPRSMIDHIFDEEMDADEELQAFKRRNPHPSLSYQGMSFAFSFFYFKFHL